MKIEVVPDRAFKKLAKALDGKPARRASIKGVNTAGKALRRDAAPLIIDNVVSTSKAALGLRARAASEKRTGKNAMAYEIRLVGAVPVSKLKASSRVVKKQPRKGTSKLSLKFPGLGGDIDFKSVRKQPGGGFELTAAGPLKARGLGPAGFRQRFRNSRQLKRRMAEAGKEAMAAFEKELLAALRR